VPSLNSSDNLDMFSITLLHERSMDQALTMSIVNYIMKRELRKVSNIMVKFHKKKVPFPNYNFMGIQDKLIMIIDN
jgi:hypothetical protein